MKEFWKPVKGYEEQYEVSSLGRVRSKLRLVPNKNGYRFVKPIVLSQKTTKSGYKEVNLNKDGKGKSHYVHRLVCECFLMDIPKGMVVNHKDCNKGNNDVLNLEIVTYSENSLHAHKNGLHSKTRYKRKFTEEQVKEIRQKRKSGINDLDLSLEYNCNKSSINRIVNNKSYKHIK